MGKIILDCDLMRYRDSGLYHYCLNLGLYVQEALQAEGRDIIAFYVPPAERESFGKNSRVITERKWHNRYFNPHIWDCNIWHAPFQSGRIPRLKKSTKVLLTIHDLNCLHEGKTQKEKKHSLQKTQQLIDRADALVCISAHCKKDVMENMDTHGIPVYIIHNGTHQVACPPPGPVAYKPSRPFVFSMGYVNRKKNFHVLLPLVQDKELELLIAGKHDEADYIHKITKLANELGITDRVKLLGPVSEADKAWYLAHCEAFLMPSLAEGFGAPVVEAMKFGKPIFLSSLTSLPEIGGEAAFYFPDFEAANMQSVFEAGMQKFSTNGMAQKVMERSCLFNWEQKAKEYISVYRSLL
jgi:glycosyltransferase involved in cell wall biosynthesis